MSSWFIDGEITSLDDAIRFFGAAFWYVVPRPPCNDSRYHIHLKSHRHWSDSARGPGWLFKDTGCFIGYIDNDYRNGATGDEAERSCMEEEARRYREAVGEDPTDPTR